MNSTLAPPINYIINKMAAPEELSDKLKYLSLQDVVSLNDELGGGAYGKVFTVATCQPYGVPNPNVSKYLDPQSIYLNLLKY